MASLRNVEVKALLAACVVAFAPTAQAQSNDSILSRHVREADDTTAQDTNSGSGIKTGHIQNGAVTNAKLAAGSVTDANIAGTISGWKLGAHSHSTGSIDGLDAALTGKANKYANVVVVAKSGGDFSDPVAALNSIVDASASRPYLVKIMPGEYTIGTSMTLRSFIDIEGSGAAVTILRDSSGYLLVSGVGTVGVEVRGLTLSSVANAVLGVWGSSVTVSDAVITCDLAATDPNCANVTVYEANLVFKNVTVDAARVGDPTTHPVWVADPSGVFEMYGGQCRTPISAGCSANSGGKIRGAGIRVDGGPWVNPHYEFSGSAKCVNCFTSDFDPIP